MQSITPSTEPDDRLFVIDCDTGIDDALALGYMLARHGDRLVAVTTVFGNVSVAQATINTLDLLAVAGRPDISVHTGAATSLDGAFAGTAHRVHGTNGFGGVALPTSARQPSAESAPAAIVRLAHEYSGRLVIIAVGPPTNLAIALSMDPSIATLIDEVVVMGGAVQHAGNATPVAEANIWHDPEAAQRVFASAMRVRMVPLDATMRQRLTAADAAQLQASSSATARLIGEALDHYLGFYEDVFGLQECALHDPLAVAVAVGDESVLHEARSPITVELANGPSRGATIVDLRRAYHGPVAVEGARNRVVLRTEDDFGSRLVAALLTLP
ncbi:nucleoside hydrolase [Microbacterium sp.]|uniref:nucleoside hydrolase n=1 Tax=Microbacterium sp. TaxID=51671 RepID=UPI0025D89229|nr:nucleoside hydrolase [Microbacterium sp.]